MEVAKQIKLNYGIDPVDIKQITNYIYQVNDGQHIYALKRSSMLIEDVKNWENAFHNAYSNDISNILPVYLTKQKMLYFESNKNIYYLSPWVEHTEASIKQLYQSIGDIHMKTKQTRTIQHKSIVSEFNTYKEYCKRSGDKLLKYMDQFEQIRYMSPFELQVCTHYRDLELILKEIGHVIDKFVTEISEIKSWSYSLCHGNLKRSHILNTKIINWEKASYNNATADLTLLFKNEFKKYDASRKAFIDLFTNYMEVNELTKSELYLLTVNLLNPTDYLKKIEQYSNKKDRSSMIYQVKELQVIYRQLIFGLHFSRYIEREYGLLSLPEIDNDDQIHSK